MSKASNTSAPPDFAGFGPLLSQVGNATFRVLSTVRTVFWSSDGQRLWTIDEQEQSPLLCCWSYPQGNILRKERLNTGRIVTATSSPFQRHLLLTENSGQMHYVTLPDSLSEPINVLPVSRRNSFSDVYLSQHWERPPKGYACFAAAQGDKETLVWSTPASEPQSIPLGKLTDLSLNGTLLAIVSPDQQTLSVHELDGTTRWERTFPPERSVKGRFARFSPDGEHIASFCILPWKGHEYLLVSLHAVKNGRLLWEKTSPRRASPQFDVARSMHFSPDGTRLWVLGYDPVLFDTKTGERLRSFLLPAEGKEHLPAWQNVKLSPNEEIFVTTPSEELQFFHAVTNKRLHSTEDHPGAVTQLAFSADNKRLAITFKRGVIRVVNPEDGSTEWTFEGLTPPFRALFFSPDAQKLFVADKHFIVAWNLADGAEVFRWDTREITWQEGQNKPSPSAQRSLQQITCAGIDPSGELLVVAGTTLFQLPKQCVLARNLHSERLCWSYGTPEWIDSLKFLTDEPTIALTNSNGIILRINRSTGKITAQSNPGPDDGSTRSCAALKNNLRLSVSPSALLRKADQELIEEFNAPWNFGSLLALSDSEHLALTDLQDGSISLWSLSKNFSLDGGLSLKEIHDVTSAFAISPSEQLIAVGTYRGLVLTYKRK